MLEMNTRKSGNRSNDSKKKAFKGRERSDKSRTNKPSKAEKKGVKAKDKGKYIDYKDKLKKGDPLPSFNEDSIRLNKYLSNAGVCSRREADVLIKTGVVTQ